MNLIDLLQTASANMLRSKLRTFLTVVAIFIGAMTLTLTNGIGTGVKGYINKQIGNLGATNILQITKNSQASTTTSGPLAYNPNEKISSRGLRGKEQQVVMTNHDIATISHIPNVSTVMPDRLISPDYIMGSAGKYQIAVSEQFGATTVDMLAGTGVSNNASDYQISVPVSYVPVLGYQTNQATIGKPVTLAISDATGAEHTVQADIVGIQQKSVIGSSAAFMNAALANKLYDLQTIGLPPAAANSYDTVVATFPASLSVTALNQLKANLQQLGYTGQTIKDTENTIFTAINVVILVFDFFGVIALLAATFGIINTLYMAVQERTMEIGLMKALGMSRRKIFSLFSIEAVLIGFWGSILGVIAASLIGEVANAIAKHSLLKTFPGFNLLTFPLTTIVVVILGIMLIAFFAGTLPALRASRKDPIEALRYE